MIISFELHEAHVVSLRQFSYDICTWEQPTKDNIELVQDNATKLKNLKMVWTATMVLQSARISSSSALDVSLLTMTTLLACVMPQRKRSSRLEYNYTNDEN